MFVSRCFVFPFICFVAQITAYYINVYRIDSEFPFILFAYCFFYKYILFISHPPLPPSLTYDNMAAKEKFRVPSADEMERSSFSVAPLFPSYKRLTVQKSDSIESDVKKTDGTLKPSSAQQQIALAPCHLASNDSSKSNEITKTAKIEGADLLSTEQKHLPPALLSVLPKPVQTLTNSVIVNPQQRGNVILKHIRNVPWEFGNIVPDYEMGKATCGIFLSLRYHQLHPEYIHNRLKQLGKSYDLRVLLAQVDLKEPHHILKELNKICILANCTLVLAFSPEEAGRYLETYKIYENKPADAIMEKSDGDYMSRFTDCLTTVKSVNKTDCINLISSFKSLNNIMNTSREALSFCPGFGPQKAQRLYDVFHEPFLKSSERN